MTDKFVVVSPVIRGIILEDEVVGADQIGPEQEIQRLLSIGAVRPLGTGDPRAKCRMLETLTIPASMDTFASWMNNVLQSGKVYPAAFKGDLGYYEFALGDGFATTRRMSGIYESPDGYHSMPLSGFYYGITSIPVSELHKHEAFSLRLIELGERLIKVQLRCDIEVFSEFYASILRHMAIRWPDTITAEPAERSARRADQADSGYSTHLKSDTEDKVSRAPSLFCPKVFMSYSWDDEEHKEWVKALAGRLRRDGVDVTLDQWHFRVGDQLTHEMEKAIGSNDNVVIICTPVYKQRSDAREGGVGYEDNIITAEIMNAENKRKFIPILRRGKWSQAAPMWLKGTIHLNFSDEPYSETRYDQLLDNLFGTVEHAPPIGTRPVKQPPSPTSQESANDPDKESFEPIFIKHIIEQDIGVPLQDGTLESDLYSIPFQLSRRPSQDWANLFVRVWNSPPEFTTLHRPGIAFVSGDRIVLTRSSLEEVKLYHRHTLQIVLDKVNQDIASHETATRDAEVRRAEQVRQHKLLAEQKAREIRFD